MSLNLKIANSVKSNNLNLKYQRFRPTGYKDIVIRKCEFVKNSKYNQIYFT